MFLKRLQEKQSTYSVNMWDREFQKQLQLRSNLQEFPLRPDTRGTISQTIVQPGDEENDYNQQSN